MHVAAGGHRKIGSLLQLDLLSARSRSPQDFTRLTLLQKLFGSSNSQANPTVRTDEDNIYNRNNVNKLLKIMMLAP